MNNSFFATRAKPDPSMDINYRVNLRPLIHLNEELGYYCLSLDVNAPDIWLCVHHEKVYDQLKARTFSMIADHYRKHVGEFPMPLEHRRHLESNWRSSQEFQQIIKECEQFNEQIYFQLRNVTKQEHPRGNYHEDE